MVMAIPLRGCHRHRASPTVSQGYLSTFGTVSSASSHVALLAKNMWEFGLIGTALLRLPAGTTSSWPFVWTLGSADPQVEQKDLLCRVDGRSNRLTLPSPEIHFSLALDEKRLAA